MCSTSTYKNVQLFSDRDPSNSSYKTILILVVKITIEIIPIEFNIQPRKFILTRSIASINSLSSNKLPFIENPQANQPFINYALLAKLRSTYSIRKLDRVSR